MPAAAGAEIPERTTRSACLLTGPAGRTGRKRASGRQADHRTLSLCLSRSSSSMISPRKFGSRNPSTMSRPGPIAVSSPLRQELPPAATPRGLAGMRRWDRHALPPTTPPPEVMRRTTDRFLREWICGRKPPRPDAEVDVLLTQPVLHPQSPPGLAGRHGRVRPGVRGPGEGGAALRGGLTRRGGCRRTQGPGPSRDTSRLPDGHGHDDDRPSGPDAAGVLPCSRGPRRRQSSCRRSSSR